MASLVRHFVALGASTAVLAAPQVGLAAPKPAPPAARADAEAYAQRAVEHFKAGDFDRAAKLFMEAYARSHKPALVFNAARAYEEAGKVGDAAALFRLYLSISEDPDGIVDARDRLKRLEAQREPVQPAPVTRAPPTAAPQVREETTAAATSPSPWRWVLAGGAVSATAGGVALVLSGKSGSQAANGMTVRREPDIAAYDTAYDRAETQWWSGVGLTAAGLALGVAATWMFIREDDGRPPRVSAGLAADGLSIVVTL